MTYGAKLSREQFIAWMGGSFVPAPVEMSSKEVENTPRDRVLLLWKDGHSRNEDRSTTPIIGVPGDIKEFYAFVSTYIATYRPFSAFFRVIPTGLLWRLAELRSISQPIDELPTSYLGAILAETRAQTGGGRMRTVSDLSIQSSLATASTAISMGIARGLDMEGIETTFENWLSTRQGLTDDPLRLQPITIWDFWSLVALSLHRNDAAKKDRIIEVITRLLVGIYADDEGEIRNGWTAVTSGLPRTQAALREMAAAREDRVRALDSALDELLSDSKADRRVKDLVAGYLASLVANGSLRYFDLLRDVEDRLPSAQLWFGFFCGFQDGSDVLTAGDCLGRRISRRELTSPSLFAVPTADIDINELDVISSGMRSDPKIRTEHSGIMRIEIYPGVVSSFRKPKDWRRNEIENTPTVNPEAVAEIKSLVDRMAYVISRINSPPQADMFPDNRSSGVTRRIRKSK